MERIFIVKHITKEDCCESVEEVLFATSDIDHAKMLLKDIDDTSFEEETDEYVETVGVYKNCYHNYHTISTLRLFEKGDDKTLKDTISEKMLPIGKAMNHILLSVSLSKLKLTESQRRQYDEWAAQWDNLKHDRNLAELVDNGEMTLEEFNQRKLSN